jgi:hypothetical protein
MDALVGVGGALVIRAVAGALPARRPRHPVRLTPAAVSAVQVAALPAAVPDGPRGRGRTPVPLVQVAVGGARVQARSP